MKRKEKESRLVHVRWHDSASGAGWYSRGQARRFVRTGLSICHTFGVLVSDDERKIVLVQTVSDNNNLNGLFEIPKVCVVSIRTVARIPIEIEL